jgi:hypothetical protein
MRITKRIDGRLARVDSALAIPERDLRFRLGLRLAVGPPVSCAAVGQCLGALFECDGDATGAFCDAPEQPEPIRIPRSLVEQWAAEPEPHAADDSSLDQFVREWARDQIGDRP